MTESDDDRMHVHAEVADALERRRGVVALESTLIAHGLPWPENLETARGSERAARTAGAVPATVAVIDGVARLGLEPGEAEEIARAADRDPGRFLKASRRDLAAVLARRGNAATTVSATLWLARRAGIGVMATGGLGGVHREAASSFDVSTDLDELARADGALVVCSGVKSILDIPTTLEALETRGVVVAGYRADEFPAFTTRSSGIRIETRVDSPDEAAELVRAHRRLGLPGAIVLAQPVSAEFALDDQVFQAALDDALADARRFGVTGKAVSPFLLERLRVATSGASLRANTALIVANASLAGAVAARLSDWAG